MSASLSTALKYATELRDTLKEHCVKHEVDDGNGGTTTLYDIKIAGSVCRGLPVVEDVDIVALPDNINKFAAALYNKVGVGVKRKSRLVSFRYGTVKVELWLPQANDYYRILTIRQGSAEWVKRVMTVAWKKQGWVGTHDGLRLRIECEERSKDKWVCVRGNPTLPPVFKSQKELFYWLGLDFIEPKNRI